jgi:hypothetical protein
MAVLPECELLLTATCTNHHMYNKTLTFLCLRELYYAFDAILRETRWSFFIKDGVAEAAWLCMATVYIFKNTLKKGILFLLSSFGKKDMERRADYEDIFGVSPDPEVEDQAEEDFDADLPPLNSKM